MTKTFALRLNKNKTFRLNFSYPDFRKEGLAALFPILSWISHLTIAAFFILIFLVDSNAIFKLIYVSGIVLFSVQLMRAMLGGLGYYPKTVLDIGGLLFVALIIISILFSSSQTDSLFGEGTLSFLSGINIFVLLIIYYLTVSQTVFAKSSTFLKGLLFISFMILGLKLLGNQELILTKEIVSAYYLPLVLPFVFLNFLSSKKILSTIFSAVFFVLVLALTNFNDFAFSFSLSVSILIMFFILILGGSSYLYESSSKLSKSFSNLLKGRSEILNFIQNSGKFIVAFLGLLGIFIFSITKSVENFSNSFDKVGEVFVKSVGGFQGFSNWLFGMGLGAFSGSFYADILRSFGVLGLAGFTILVCLSLYYTFRTLSKTYKERNYPQSGIVLGLFMSFLATLVYFAFESVSIYGYIFFWMLVMVIGSYATNMLYKHEVRLNSLVQPKSIKMKRFVSQVRPVAISIVAAVAIISVYLIARR